MPLRHHVIPFPVFYDPLLLRNPPFPKCIILIHHFHAPITLTSPHTLIMIVVVGKRRFSPKVGYSKNDRVEMYQ